MAIKRHPALQQLSREHHHGLLLCWKIKQGLFRGVAISRIKTYTDWFYKNHLLNHFKIEERHVFPILDQEHPHILQAIADHRLLDQLFNDSNDLEHSLKTIEFELEKHIRFEERTLFNEIESAATPAQLVLIKELHAEGNFVENDTDPFWK